MNQGCCRGGFQLINSPTTWCDGTVPGVGCCLNTGRGTRIISRHGGAEDSTGVGVSYLGVCGRSTASDCPEAILVTTGLRDGWTHRHHPAHSGRIRPRADRSALISGAHRSPRAGLVAAVALGLIQRVVGRGVEGSQVDRVGGRMGKADAHR
jgi:hypothetical protein